MFKTFSWEQQNLGCTKHLGGAAPRGYRPGFIERQQFSKSSFPEGSKNPFPTPVFTLLATCCDFSEIGFLLISVVSRVVCGADLCLLLRKCCIDGESVAASRVNRSLVPTHQHRARAASTVFQVFGMTRPGVKPSYELCSCVQYEHLKFPKTICKETRCIADGHAICCGQT